MTTFPRCRLLWQSPLAAGKGGLLQQLHLSSGWPPTPGGLLLPFPDLAMGAALGLAMVCLHPAVHTGSPG